MKNVIKEYGFELLKIFLSVIFLIVAILFKNNQVLSIVFYVLSAIIVGYELIIGAIKDFLKKEFINENTLMIIACATSFIISAYLEGCLILILFSFGELLEDLAVDNSKKQIEALQKLKVKQVKVLLNGEIVLSKPEEVEIGSILQVNKGDAVGIDGLLLSDDACIDYSAVFGESKLYQLSKGEQVLSGGINRGNVLNIQTTKEYKDSTVESIISIIENTDKKSKTQKFISVFAKYYTPIVVLLALTVGGIVPLFDAYDFTKWIYKALNFLVVSCPCALVISIPLCYFIGIGSLAKSGILVKGSAVLDNISKASRIVFDKTGTLTEGILCVGEVEYFGETDSSILSIAYSMEKASNHPIAKAICEYIEKQNIGCADLGMKSISEQEGKGLYCVYNGVEYAIGNGKIFSSDYKDDGDFTTVYFEADKKLIAKFILTDVIKENAFLTVDKLKKDGIKDILIVSGDNENCVKAVADKVGIEKYYYSQLPKEKVEKVNEQGKTTVFVGDGINDAPSIKNAEVGVAMGGLGSELAIECADAVIMDDDLLKIPKLIKHSKKIRKTVKINVFLCIFIKFLIMGLSLVIKLPVFVALIGDVGVLIVAIMISFTNFFVKKS